MLQAIYFLLFIFYVFILFFLQNKTILGIIFLLQMIFLLFKKISIKKAWNSILHLMPFILFTFFCNLFFESFNYALWIGIKLIFVCNATFIYKNKVGTLNIIEAISFIFTPLKFLGITSKDISLMLNISLTFIPNFLRDFKQIQLSLKAKGAKIYSMQSIKCISKLLLISIFKKTQEMELTLKNKAYTE